MRSGQQAAFLVVVVALVATGLSVWATVLRLSSPHSGVVVAGDSYGPTGVTIRRTDAAAPGLRDGDVLTRIDGRPLVEWAGSLLDPGRQRLELAVGRPVDVEVVRATDAVTLPVVAVPPPGPATLLASWGTLTFVVALLVIAAYVFWRRPASPAAGGCCSPVSGPAGAHSPSCWASTR